MLHCASEGGQAPGVITLFLNDCVREVTSLFILMEAGLLQYNNHKAGIVGMVRNERGVVQIEQ